MTRLPPRNSYAAMGFEAKFNQDYARFNQPDFTPYEQLVRLIDGDRNNGEISRHFGVRPQAVRKWRPWVDSIRTKGL